jgi:hypothetical protein
VLLDSFAVLFSGECNPRFGQPSVTESTVSRALAVCKIANALTDADYSSNVAIATGI